MNQLYVRTLSVLILTLSTLTSFAQYPDWNWVSTAHSGIFYNRQWEGVADHSGGFLITGYFSGSMTLPGDTTGSTIQGNAEDMFIVKVDSAGNHAWAFDEGGTTDDTRSYALTVDENNRVFYGGFFDDEGYFGSGYIQSAGGDDAIIIARNEDGSYRWRKHMSNASWATVRYLDSDHNGNIIALGEYNESLNLVGQTITDTTTSGYSSFLVSYRSNNGSRNWGMDIPSEPFAPARAMSCDADGNIYLSFTGLPAASDWKVGSLTLAPENGLTTAIVKVNNDGTFAWAKRAYARHIETSPDNKIYLIGEAAGSYSYGNTSIPVGAQTDVYVLQIGQDGDLLNHVVLAGNVDEVSIDACVDDSGNVFVMGPLEATLQVSGQTLNSTSTADHYLLMMDENLDVQLLESIGGNNINLRYVDTKKYPFVGYTGGFSNDQNIGGFPVIDEGNSAYFITQYQIDSIKTPVVEDTTTAIVDRTSGDGLRLFPNPSDGLLQLSLGKPIQEGDVIVRDITGRPMHDYAFYGSENGAVLRFDAESTGLRIIEVYNGSKLYIERVIVR